jgi:hypothetical protein
MARPQTNVPVTNALLASGKGVVKTEALGAEAPGSGPYDPVPGRHPIEGARAHSSATRDTDPSATLDVHAMEKPPGRCS